MAAWQGMAVSRGGSLEQRDDTAALAGHESPRASGPRAAAEPSLPPTPAADAQAQAEKRAASRRQDLITRLGTAAVLIPYVLWVIFHGGLAYLASVIVIGLLAQKEFYGLIVDKGAKPLQAVGLVFGAAVILVAHIGNEYHAMLLMTLSLLVMMGAQLRKAEIHEAMASISGTFFGVFYVAWLLSHAVLLRKFTASAAAHADAASLRTMGFTPDTGIFLMYFTLVTIVACDAGAYFAGRAWGRQKLAPAISPNKSVEGAMGGIVAGALLGVATKLVFDAFWPDSSAALPWSVAIVFAFVLCIVGIVGDLVESLLKRDAAVKDTGALLPGMGGVLDRIDAPLLGLPVMYYLMLGYVFFFQFD